jgi:hypothetical protein
MLRQHANALDDGADGVRPSFLQPRQAVGGQPAVPLVSPLQLRGKPLEADIVQEGVGCATDHLHRVIDRALPRASLPRMPSLPENLLDLLLLELEGDEKLGRAVQNRIEADEEAALGVDAHQQRRVEPERVLPKVVEFGQPGGENLGGIFDLKPVLVAGTIAGRLRGGEERLGDDAEALAIMCLGRNPEGRLGGRCGAKNPAAAATQRIEDEAQQRLSGRSAHSLALEVHVVALSANKR